MLIKSPLKLNVLAEFCAWFYVTIVVAGLLLFFLVGDNWWPATFLLFGPRWVLAVPLSFLIPFSIWQRRRLIIPLVCCALLIFVFLFDLRFSFSRALSVNSRVVRILTCNVANDSFNALRLISVIKNNGADVVALQECPPDLRLKLPINWYSVQKGELVIMSRFPIKEENSLKAIHPPHKSPRFGALQCVVKLPGADVSFVTVHFPSPRFGLQNLLDKKTIINLARIKLFENETANRWKAAREVQELVATSALPVIVAGDFNMPVQSAIYKEYWSRYNNAFSMAGTGYGWTEFNRFRGIPIAVRIDHILTAKGVIPRICEVGPDIGSDHLPLIADITY